MKRTLWSLLAILLAVPAFGQVTIYQGTDTTVNFKLTSKADGSDITGATIGSITIKIYKLSNTLSASVVAATCATSSSTHDCVEKTGSIGVYNAEIPAGDLDTLGPIDFCFVYTGAYTDCKTYEVVATASGAVNREGDVTSESDILTAVGANASAVAAVQAAVNLLDVLPKNTAASNYEFDMWSASTGLGLAGETVTCTRRIDGGSSAPTTNSPTDKGGGVYSLNMSAADLNGDRITFTCISSNTIETHIYIGTQH